MTFAVPGLFVIPRLSLQKHNNFEFIMKQGTNRNPMSPVNKIVYGKKKV